MKLKLEELKLKIPSIDLLDSRKIIGGSSYNIDTTKIVGESPDEYRDHDENNQDRERDNEQEPGPGGGPVNNNGYDHNSTNPGNSWFGNPNDTSKMPKGEKQVGNMCTVESIALILQYFGINVNATSLVNNYLFKILGGSETLIMLSQGFDNQAVEKVLNYFFDYSSGLTVEDIFAEWAKGNVILGIQNIAEGGVGHAIVITD